MYCVCPLCAGGCYAADERNTPLAEKQRILSQPQRRVKCPATELQAGGRIYAESGGMLYYVLSHTFSIGHIIRIDKQCSKSVRKERSAPSVPDLLLQRDPSAEAPH